MSPRAGIDPLQTTEVTKRVVAGRPEGNGGLSGPPRRHHGPTDSPVGSGGLGEDARGRWGDRPAVLDPRDSPVGGRDLRDRGEADRVGDRARMGLTSWDDLRDSPVGAADGARRTRPASSGPWHAGERASPPGPSGGSGATCPPGTAGGDGAPSRDGPAGDRGRGSGRAGRSPREGQPGEAGQLASGELARGWRAGGGPGRRRGRRVDQLTDRPGPAGMDRPAGWQEAVAELARRAGRGR
ncbi:hypothetical protein N7462_008223 [Penicillium macrosclerotiorum]|nr:hypothetical protein N7462_008223 [Penicillium macrosclerotiorum]